MIRKRGMRILVSMVLCGVMVLCYGHGNRAGSETQNSWNGLDNAPPGSQVQKVKGYIGSEACQACHETEYRNFKAYAKKARSYESVVKMKKGLTDEEFRGCFECHTTGYGKASGFRSEEETPHLKNAGCEVCHGPGSLHVSTGDPREIKGDVTMKDCEVCHNSERVTDFNYKPMIYGGAH